MLILSIHEHGTCFHLSVSSLISLISFVCCAAPVMLADKHLVLWSGSLFQTNGCLSFGAIIGHSFVHRTNRGENDRIGVHDNSDYKHKTLLGEGKIDTCKTRNIDSSLHLNLIGVKKLNTQLLVFHCIWFHYVFFQFSLDS